MPERKAPLGQCFKWEFKKDRLKERVKQCSSNPNRVLEKKKSEPLSNHRELDRLLQVTPKKGKTRRKRTSCVSEGQDGTQTERMTMERTLNKSRLQVFCLFL